MGTEPSLSEPSRRAAQQPRERTGAQDNRYDVVVVGGGHNGLVAAAYLSRAGLRVLILERREQVGGACVTEELAPDARFSSCASVVSCLRPEIVDELDLERYGLELYAPEAQAFALNEDGSHLFLWPELDRSIRSLDRLSRGDGDGLVEFGLRLRRFASFLTPHLLREPPTLAEVIGEFESAGEIDLYHEFVDLSVATLVGRYFSHELTRGAFALLALGSFFGGPHAPGTAYGLSHHSWAEFRGEFGRAALARGGMGSISDAIARSAKAAGATIRTGAQVQRIVSRGGRARGVVLDDGTEIDARVVISNASPRSTYLSLLDTTQLSPRTLEQARAIDVRGTMARVLLLVSELPRYEATARDSGPHNRTVNLLGTTLERYQACWERQLRGELADEYPLELLIQSTTDPALSPPGLHTVGIGVQQLPFEFARGSWDERREEFTAIVLQSLFRYAPNLERAIEGSWTITPLDLEREYGMAGGNAFQGAMIPFQRFASRPFPGAGGYRTEIAGLYLCGAGTHPGGGVMGAAGHNVAAVVLSDLQRSPLQGPTLPAAKRRSGDEFVLRAMEQPVMRRVLSWAARRRFLRPLVRAATRRPRR